MRAESPLLRALSAGRLVLVPNAELASALFDAVERSHRDAGSEIWLTPRIRDFSSWLREKHLQRQLFDLTAPRVMSEIEERELWRSVLESSELSRDFVEVAAASRAARRARRVLHEYGIPEAAIAFETTDESNAFLSWNAAFDARCRALGCIGGSALLTRLTTAAAANGEALSFIESPLWRPVARQWLIRHAEPLPATALPASTVRLVAAASPAAELAAAADWARQQLLANERFRAWICVPDLDRRRSETVDAFDAALAPRRFMLTGASHAAPYAVAGGTPLAHYAPVRAALELLSCSAGVLSFARFSALLRAPELRSEQGDNATAVLDLALRRCAPHEAPLKTYIEIAQRALRKRELGAVAALQRLQTACSILDEAPPRQRFSGWLARWNLAFDAAPWALRHRWSSTEFQAAERFRELLAALATSDDFFGVQSQDSAQRILQRAARDTDFQIQTGVPPIAISGQLMDPWLNYDGLWLAGCDDARWPPPVEPVPLLPVRLQRQYGVIAASAELQLREALELQSRWLARSSEAVFSYADAGDTRTMAPSPLLPALPLSRSAAPPQPHWRSLLQAAPPLEVLADSIAPPFQSTEALRGVATLRAQSLCAFRGFAETRLALQPLELPVPGFNERERGDIVHHALEYVWSVLRDSSALNLSAERENELLADAAARSIQAQIRSRDPGARWRAREQVRIVSLLGKWLEVERQRAPFVVENLEGAAQWARHGGLEFAVRIDRVDRLADGARVLIDYKTGGAQRDWAGERPANPQLPIYALLQPENLIAVAYGRVNAGNPCFVAESERRDLFKKGGRPSRLEGLPTFAALLQLWSKRIERLAAEFATGQAEVAPTLTACRYCGLQALCRVPAALDDAADIDDSAEAVV